jgi:mRNA-degrading endonuclease RelE of RelBE toxin-antitoxin system
MPEFVFTNWAEKQFRTLPSALQDRIIKKLKQLNPGQNRVIVLDIGHRREVYR